MKLYTGGVFDHAEVNCFLGIPIRKIVLSSHISLKNLLRSNRHPNGMGQPIVGVYFRRGHLIVVGMVALGLINRQANNKSCRRKNLRMPQCDTGLATSNNIPTTIFVSNNSSGTKEER